MREHIAVLYGGPGAEAGVSKSSALSVEKALKHLNLPYTLVEFKPNWVANLLELQPTFVFIAMHGTPGEDGSVQAVLESLNIPYNGSNMRSSVLCMDKSVAKKVIQTVDVPVAQEQLFKPTDIIPQNLQDLKIPLPFVFKPNDGGSSVGVEIVTQAEDWPAAHARIIETQKKYQYTFLLEEFIEGKELSATVKDGEALGVIEIVPQGHKFYDYQSKYDTGGSQHIYPAPIATEVYKEIELLAVKTHKALDCSGITRVDFRYNEKQKKLVVLEINTLPGMTSTSLVPEMARYHGFSFEDLIAWIIKDGKCNHKTKNLKGQ